MRTILTLTLLLSTSPLLAAEKAAEKAPEKAEPAEPAMKLIQTVTIEKREGSRNAALDNVRVHGDFVYARAGKRLIWFRRGEDGKLTEAGRMTQGADGVVYSSMLFVGDRLYMLRLKGKYQRPRKARLLYFDVDPKTGKPTEVGGVEAPDTWPSCSYEPLQAAPDGKSIYYLAMPPRSDEEVVRFELDEDGKPTLTGTVSGKGIGSSAKPIGDSTMILSPDGKHIYTISATEHAVGVVEVGEEGKLGFVETVDLNKLVPDLNPESQKWNQTFAWPALAISPDGKQVYVNLWSYGRGHGDCVGLYNRDAETGKLSLVGKLDWPEGVKGLRLAFTQDGQAGCFGSLTGPVTYFKRDPESGKLTKVQSFPETSGPERAGPCLYDMTLDEKAGYAYFADLYGALFVFKMP
jgi:hypothetical protein